jgi:hypothetical protein
MKFSVTVLAALACAGALPAAAQDEALRFELTPYAGYRLGGKFTAQDGGGSFELRESAAQGLIFDIRAKDVNTQWEVLYAHQQTEVETQPGFGGGPLLDLDADYYHFGGTYLFDGENVRPFIALTLGLARFEPAPSGLEAENYFSGSLAGGLQLRASQRIGVRLEGRVFGTLVNSDGALFCRTGGAINTCALSINGDALFQWEARAGLVFRF